MYANDISQCISQPGACILYADDRTYDQPAKLIVEAIDIVNKYLKLLKQRLHASGLVSVSVSVFISVSF